MFVTVRSPIQQIENTNATVTRGRVSRSTITPGALEGSNVDISSEFTNMIVTQRGFQANAKVVTTADEILNDLVNLRR